MQQILLKESFQGESRLKINTRKYGEVEIDEAKVLEMNDGLPGFESYTRFALLEDPNMKPFCWFQSVEEPDLALVVMDPFIFMPEYDIDLETVISMKEWQDIEKKDLAVYVVINTSNRENEKKITANLIGPLVINLKNNEVVQVVFSDTPYSHQYDILGS